MNDNTAQETSAQRGDSLVGTSGGFDWLDENRTSGFSTWADEIAHVEAQGYALVQPDYHIPHWTGASTAPKLYVNGIYGVREMNAAFDRPARDIGYPLFFKSNTKV